MILLLKVFKAVPRVIRPHPEIFSDATSMTVSEAVDLAVESATLTA
jgi:hypothetical protein